MRITLDELEKLEPTGIAATLARDYSDDERLTAIFKVREAKYVPPYVHLRSWIDEKMFTGSFTARDLERIESDNNVVSVSLNRSLRAFK